MALGLVMLLVAGCSDMDMAGPVTIVDQTSGAIDVTLHETSGQGPMHTIARGEQYGFFASLLNSCMTGTLVATQDGRTIATIVKPCESSEWKITGDGASQSH